MKAGVYKATLKLKPSYTIQGIPITLHVKF